MNSHNLVIYELDELYKIFEEIKKDINFNFEKINKQELLKLNSSSKCLILTKNEIPGLDNQIILNKFPVSIFKILEKINIEFIKKNFHEQSEILIGNYIFNINAREMSSTNNRLKLTEKEINSISNRLKNKDFIAKAPKKVVEENKIKIEDMMQNKERLSSSKDLIKKLIK